MNDLIEVSWEGLKSSMLAKGIQSRLQWIKEKNTYRVFLFDNPMKFATTLQITEPKNAEQHEFESQYMGKSNLVLSPIDSDNSTLQRMKMTKAGWNYQFHFIEFETNKLASVYNCGPNNVDLGYTTLSFKKGDGTALANPQQLTLDTQSIITQVDWEMKNDIEAFGGFVKQKAVPIEAVRLWAVGAPDIPKQLGGNKEFVQGGVNLEFFGTGDVIDADGKTPKLLLYSSVYHTNKFRITARTTSAGFKHKIAVVFKVFIP